MIYPSALLADGFSSSGRTKGFQMNDSTLLAFRAIADAMRGNETNDWQWVGKWESQRHFGITEKRAKELAARHGGEARKMTGGAS